MPINLTGKKGKFCAVNRCVELNNLFTKVINSSRFSNHTIDLILLESPLVQVYRNLHGAFQKHFLHTHLLKKERSRYSPYVCRTMQTLGKIPTAQYLNLIEQNTRCKELCGVDWFFSTKEAVVDDTKRGD